MCKIRFIVETTSAAMDRNGNTEHFARITSTETGKHLALHTGGPRNAAGMLRNLCQWDELYCTECTIPIRQWQAASKGVVLYEGSTTTRDIAALEATP